MVETHGPSGLRNAERSLRSLPSLKRLVLFPRTSVNTSCGQSFQNLVYSTQARRVTTSLNQRSRRPLLTESIQTATVDLSWPGTKTGTWLKCRPGAVARGIRDEGTQPACGGPPPPGAAEAARRSAGSPRGLRGLTRPVRRRRRAPRPGRRPQQRSAAARAPGWRGGPLPERWRRRSHTGGIRWGWWRPTALRGYGMRSGRYAPYPLSNALYFFRARLSIPHVASLSRT